MIATQKRHILAWIRVLWHILPENPPVDFGCSELHEHGKNENKNLAIANRSRVSCAHNTLRASGLNITPRPWNLG